MRFLRRRQKESVLRRLVRQIRECYLYCKVYAAEKIAASVARRHMKMANTQKGWIKFKTRWAGRKYFLQAGICRFARRSGSYKNL